MKKNIFKKQQRFKSYYHDMYIEEINKVVLSSKDNKRLQIFDRVTIFPHTASDFKVCEDEMLNVRKAKETLKILSKDCENKFYVTCNIFLSYMKTQCAMEIKKYVKFEMKKKC